MREFSSFSHVWVTDYEFIETDGNIPIPICYTAYDLVTHAWHQVWLYQNPHPQLRYSLGDDSLFVAYAAAAELENQITLGWELPNHTLDLFYEFLWYTNGVLPRGNTGVSRSLLNACTFFGLDTMSAAYKDQMHVRLGDVDYVSDPRNKAEILVYNRRDVEITAMLLRHMLPVIDFPRALLRGKYSGVQAHVHYAGIPFDMDTFNDIRNPQTWEKFLTDAHNRVNDLIPVFNGRSLCYNLLDQWAVEQHIPWERTEKGFLRLDGEYLKQLAKVHPEINPLKELLYTRNTLKLGNFPIGTDGRNRFYLNPFGTVTGRNAPSSSRAVFGPAVWVRSFIQAPHGYSIAYVDYSQQEPAIAAALSNDPAMIRGYKSGDMYIAFARLADAVPYSATKKTHPLEREVYKICYMSIMFGSSAPGVAKQLGCSLEYANHLVKQFRKAFPTYWNWNLQMVAGAKSQGEIRTLFGWKFQTRNAKIGTLKNFHMQGNGAEMTRIAACAVIDAGIQIDAIVHDALLIEGKIEDMPDIIALVQNIMSDVSQEMLDVIRVRTEATVYPHPQHFQDPRGIEMWNTVTGSIRRERN